MGGFVIGVVGLLAWLGNFTAIYIFMTTKALRSPANMLVVNLASSDFIMISCMSPPMVVNCYYRTWAFSRFSCQLYAFIGSICGLASISTMVFITEDRYKVIVKGISGKPLTSGGAFLRILFIWVFAALWTLPPFFGWNRYVPEGNLTACGTDYLSQDFLSHSYLYGLCFIGWPVPITSIYHIRHSRLRLQLLVQLRHHGVCGHSIHRIHHNLHIHHIRHSRHQLQLLVQRRHHVACDHSIHRIHHNRHIHHIRHSRHRRKPM